MKEKEKMSELYNYMKNYIYIGNVICNIVEKNSRHNIYLLLEINTYQMKCKMKNNNLYII